MWPRDLVRSPRRLLAVFGAAALVYVSAPASVRVAPAMQPPVPQSTPADDPQRPPEDRVIISGVVPLRATADRGAIDVGDVLVISPVDGYATKGTEADRMSRAITGTALEPLPEGAGTILVRLMPP